MLIQDVSSEESCTMGGSRIFLVLKDISNTEDIIPELQVFLHEAPQPNLQMLVNQPEKETDSFYFHYSEHKADEGQYRGKRCVLCRGLLD